MPRLVVATVAVALASGVLFAILRPHGTERVPLPTVVEQTAVPTPAPSVVVDVAGAVQRPGVVRLPAGTRVTDAIAAAGGVTPDADLGLLNRAALLRDGARVYVPRLGETPPAGSVGTPSETKVDLNQATAAELEALPGIGPSTAGRIVRSREQRPFAKIDELQTRGLVSARVLADIRDLLVLH